MQKVFSKKSIAVNRKFQNNNKEESSMIQPLLLILVFLLTSFHLEAKNVRITNELRVFKPNKLPVWSIEINKNQNKAQLDPLKLNFPELENHYLKAYNFSVISPKDVKKYSKEKAQSFLFDPQNLLKIREYKDVIRFLDYHSSDSTIDIYIYLFDKKQKIPTEIEAYQIMDRFYANGKNCLIAYYFLGAPSRSIIAYSSHLKNSPLFDRQEKILQSSVIEAHKKDEPSDQLLRFCSQLSIKLYEVNKTTDDRNVESLFNLKYPKNDKLGIKKYVETFTHQLSEFKILIISTGLAVIGICIAIMIRRKNQCYMLPEIIENQRLGCPNAAGVGAAICYKNQKISPKEQRKNLKNYI
jgi:hypothetical protein